MLIGACGTSTPPSPPTNAPLASPQQLELASEDRSALAEALAVEGGVLARTAAGNLVRFGAALQPVRDASPVTKLAAIAGERGRYYAALVDGTVVSLDPATLVTQRITSVAGTPSWLAVHGDELVVFTRATGAKRFQLQVFHQGTQRTRSIAIPDDGSPAMSIGKPSTWLLDGGHVWFGIDAGEWGGAVGKVDLATGTTTMIKHREPVFGFVAHRGRVWAHGGMTHMGHTEGYVAELTAGTSKTIWQRHNSQHSQPTSPRALPVVRMIPEGGGFLVLVWNELYQVDPGFTTWTRMAAIRAREHAGRPDAVGNYPATIAMFRAGGQLVFATSRDGLFVSRGTKIEPASN